MRQYWTPEQIEILKQMYPDNYAADIGRILGKSNSSIYYMANQLGLKKSMAFRQMELKRQGARLKVVGEKHRFNSGHTPVNKGKKMSPEVYQKVRHTMFKPGQMPHNSRHDGFERISKDGYIEVRIRPGKFMLKHRLIWENHHGKIPAGYIVVFLDRNPMNCTIENLTLISRKENMSRNSIHRLPVELKSTIKLVNKLKRVIYAKEQD